MPAEVPSAAETRGASLEALAARITSLAADIEGAMCRWLALVAEFDRREGWALEGCSSCAAWVSWRCGVGSVAAREHVRVARRLEELPAVQAAFERSELTYSKVRALTRLEDVAKEKELVELAQHATASQLERAVRGYRSAARVEQDAERSVAERFLSCEWDDDGSLRIRGRVAAEDGALLLRAIEAAQHELWNATSAEPEGASAEARSDAEPPPPAGARAADALVHIAECALAASSAGRTGGDRAQIVVHVDAAALRAEARRGAADGSAQPQVEGGPCVPAETARRLACDASLVRILERDGHDAMPTPR